MVNLLQYSIDDRVILMYNSLKHGNIMRSHPSYDELLFKNFSDVQTQGDAYLIALMFHKLIPDQILICRSTTLLRNEWTTILDVLVDQSKRKDNTFATSLFIDAFKDLGFVHSYQCNKNELDIAANFKERNVHIKLRYPLDHLLQMKSH